MKIKSNPTVCPLSHPWEITPNLRQKKLYKTYSKQHTRIHFHTRKIWLRNRQANEKIHVFTNLTTKENNVLDEKTKNICKEERNSGGPQNEKKNNEGGTKILKQENTEILHCVVGRAT